jgi:UDP-glucose 4-epimerase
MSILITGGAGYIGSHTAKILDESGLDVVILDSLITGRREDLRWGAFVEGNIADVGLVRSIIRRYAVTADVINCQMRGRKTHPKVSKIGVSEGGRGCDGHAHRMRRS